MFYKNYKEQNEGNAEKDSQGKYQRFYLRKDLTTMWARALSHKKQVQEVLVFILQFTSFFYIKYASACLALSTGPSRFLCSLTANEAFGCGCVKTLFGHFPSDQIATRLVSD